MYTIDKLMYRKKIQNKIEWFCVLLVYIKVYVCKAVSTLVILVVFSPITIEDKHKLFKRGLRFHFV